LTVNRGRKWGNARSRTEGAGIQARRSSGVKIGSILERSRVKVFLLISAEDQIIFAVFSG
jgi:hypothetical protein